MEEEKLNTETLQTPFEENAHKLKEAIDRANEPLSPDEREILVYRFGLVDGIPRTRNQVAEITGKNGEKVRKLEKVGIRKAIQDPILSLMKQSMNRWGRHDRHQGKEGNYDLEVSLMLAEQAHELAKLLTFVGPTTGRKSKEN